MYGKLTESGIEYAPLNKGNVFNFGTKANEDQLLELGYLPVVDGDIPEVGENQTLKDVFTQEADRIVHGYEVVDLPPNPLTKMAELILAFTGVNTDET